LLELKLVLELKNVKYVLTVMEISSMELIMSPVITHGNPVSFLKADEELLSIFFIYHIPLINSLIIRRIY